MILQNTNVCAAAKIYQHKFDRKLKKQTFHADKFSNHDKNKFIQLL